MAPSASETRSNEESLKSQLSEPPTPSIPNLKALLTPDIDRRISAAEAIARQQPPDAQPAVQTQELAVVNQKLAKPQIAPASKLLPNSLPEVSAADDGNLVASSEVTNSQQLRSIAAPFLNQIKGTNADDDITGTDKYADYIRGLNGNDTLRGGNGNDFVRGGNGDDVISGDNVVERTTESNDLLIGGNGNDKLFGRIGTDFLVAGNGNDQLFGGSDQDKLYGGNGDDQLFGGIVEGDVANRGPDGNDRLSGGAGNDFLSGAEGDDLLLGAKWGSRGAGEVDIMEGGQGRDRFVLGNRVGAFYTQGGAAQDFAIILDFEVDTDIVRLHGSANDYVLGYDSTENATALGYLGGGGYEFVGVFVDQDISSVSLDSSSFRYA